MPFFFSPQRRRDLFRVRAEPQPDPRPDTAEHDRPEVGGGRVGGGLRGGHEVGAGGGKGGGEEQALEGQAASTSREGHFHLSVGVLLGVRTKGPFTSVALRDKAELFLSEKRKKQENCGKFFSFWFVVRGGKWSDISLVRLPDFNPTENILSCLHTLRSGTLCCHGNRRNWWTMDL